MRSLGAVPAGLKRFVTPQEKLLPHMPGLCGYGTRWCKCASPVRHACSFPAGMWCELQKKLRLPQRKINELQDEFTKGTTTRYKSKFD